MVGGRVTHHWQQEEDEIRGRLRLVEATLSEMMVTLRRIETTVIH